MAIDQSILQLKIIYFNNLTILFHDQDEQIFHEKVVMQLGFKTLRMMGLNKNKKLWPLNFSFV